MSSSSSLDRSKSWLVPVVEAGVSAMLLVCCYGAAPTVVSASGPRAAPQSTAAVLRVFECELSGFGRRAHARLYRLPGPLYCRLG